MLREAPNLAEHELDGATQISAVLVAQSPNWYRPAFRLGFDAKH